MYGWAEARHSAPRTCRETASLPLRRDRPPARCRTRRRGRRRPLGHLGRLHAVGEHEALEETLLESLAEHRDAIPRIGDHDQRLRLALGGLRQLAAIGCLALLVGDARRDLARERPSEGIGQTLAVIVVDVNQSNLLDALLAHQVGEHLALHGVVGRGAEQKPVVLERRDHRRGRRARDLRHARRGGHRGGDRDGDAGGQGADDAGHAVDIDDALRGVDPDLRVGRVVGGHQLDLSAKHAARLVHLVDRQLDAPEPGLAVHLERARG